MMIRVMNHNRHTLIYVDLLEIGAGASMNKLDRRLDGRRMHSAVSVYRLRGRLWQRRTLQYLFSCHRRNGEFFNRLRRHLPGRPSQASEC